jgi:hypothetical protein
MGLWASVKKSHFLGPVPYILLTLFLKDNRLCPYHSDDVLNSPKALHAAAQQLLANITAFDEILRFFSEKRKYYSKPLFLICDHYTGYFSEVMDVQHSIFMKN